MQWRAFWFCTVRCSHSNTSALESCDEPHSAVQCCTMYIPLPKCSSKAPPTPIYTPDTNSHLGALYLISFSTTSLKSIHVPPSQDSKFRISISIHFFAMCVCVCVFTEKTGKMWTQSTLWRIVLLIHVCTLCTQWKTVVHVHTEHKNLWRKALHPPPTEHTEEKHNNLWRKPPTLIHPPDRRSYLAPPKLVFTSLTHQPLLLQGQFSGCCFFFRYYICRNWNMVV